MNKNLKKVKFSLTGRSEIFLLKNSIEQTIETNRTRKKLNPKLKKAVNFIDHK
jgi:hypothetical protein